MNAAFTDGHVHDLMIGQFFLEVAIRDFGGPVRQRAQNHDLKEPKEEQAGYQVTGYAQSAASFFLFVFGTRLSARSFCHCRPPFNCFEFQ